MSCFLLKILLIPTYKNHSEKGYMLKYILCYFERNVFSNSGGHQNSMWYFHDYFLNKLLPILVTENNICLQCYSHKINQLETILCSIFSVRHTNTLTYFPNSDTNISLYSTGELAKTISCGSSIIYQCFFKGNSHKKFPKCIDT